MQDLEFYKDKLKCDTNDQVFDYLAKTLKPSNILWSYFVNWEKVFAMTKKIEVDLNILNYLIGKTDFDKEFRYLIAQYPQITRVIPALVVRSKRGAQKFKILIDHKSKKLTYEDYDFDKDNPTKDDVEKYIHFLEKTGFKKLIESKKIKNLVDYMFGIEAGLDSNGRKNRSGKAMENIVQVFVDDICKKRKFRYLVQANAEKINEEFGYSIPVDKSSRRYDFVIDNGKELFLVETNFYGGSGSKLKSTAGEYRNLFDVLKGKYKFVWITDGQGWLSAARPLRETFDHNDYLFNLSMLEKGILEYVV